MVIEWALLGGVAVKAAVSSGAAKLAGIGVEKGKAKIFPGELEKAVAAGIAEAKAEDDLYPPSQHLFYRCYENDRDALLAKVIEHSATLAELRKPLEESGNIEVDCLVKVVESVAAELKLELMAGSLERWVKTFAQTYFDRTKAAIVFQVAKEQYLRQLAQRLDDVKFVGIAVPGDEVEKQETLEQIFVMPDVREEQSKSIGRMFDRKGAKDILMDGMFGSDQSRSLLEEQKEWAIRDRSSPRISARDVLKQSKNKAVLLGAPGSGKTTLASYLGLMLANDPTNIGFDANGDWLPIVVRIRDWILSPGVGLLEYLRSYAEKMTVKSLPIGFFEYWLDRGKALILLDGLDEVVDEAQRRKVAEEIETFLHRYQDNPAVITSRPAGYRWDFFNLDEFPHYTLEPFDERQRNEFIEHWYDSRVKDDKAKADRLKADLQKAFKGNDRIQKLAENPLLLTIIALIHRYQAELPRQRFKLYEKAVETLLTSWDSGKELKLYEVLEYLKADDLLYVLKKLAYWIHDQGNAGETDSGTLIDKDELIRQLCKQICNLKSCKPHEAKQESGRFVDFIQRRTGLLNEQGRDRYAFVHKTFQEYLTAEEIYDRFEEGEDEVILDHIRDHLHDGHWREVLLLLVSKLKKKRAAKAIEAVLKAGSEYEKWLHQDLFFVGWCLTEDPVDLKVVAPELVGEILDRLVAIEVGDTERMGEEAREEGSKIIHRLGGTAFEREIWNRLNDCGEAIDRFRLLEFQASLGQEEKAIEVLISLFKNESSSHRERRHARFSLLKIAENTSSKVRNELHDLLENDEAVKVLKDLMISMLPLMSFDQLVDGSREGVNRWFDLLKNEDSDVRLSTAESLVKLGNTSTEVVSGLFRLLNDNAPYIRSSSAKALSRLNQKSETILPDVVQWIETQPDDVPIGAAIDGLRSMIE